MEIDAIKKKVLEDVDPETRRKKKKEMRIQRLIVTLQFLGIAAVVILIFYILMGISTVDGNSMTRTSLYITEDVRNIRPETSWRSPGHPERIM